MSEKEFNERAKRAGKKPDVNRNAGKDLFDDFLNEMYHEVFASEFEKENPDAYRHQLNNFLYEHGL